MVPVCQFCGFMGRWFMKGTMTSACFSVFKKAVPQSCLDAKHFSSFPYATVPFKLLTHCWKSERVSLSKSLCRFFKRNCLGLQKFLPLTFLSYGHLSSWQWNPGLRAWCGAETPTLETSLPFLSTTHRYGTSPYHVSTPPTSLDGYCFFNSIVVRLQFKFLTVLSDGCSIV